MKPYYLDDMCLPKTGILSLNDFSTGYAIRQESPITPSGNFVYVENGSGHSLNLEGGDNTGLKLVEIGMAEYRAFPSEKRIKTRNDHEGTRTRGHYILMDLQTDPMRPQNTRKVILFIAHFGGSFQHYQSNVMTNDEDVVTRFLELIQEVVDTLKKPNRLLTGRVEVNEHALFLNQQLEKAIKSVQKT